METIDRKNYSGNEQRHYHALRGMPKAINFSLDSKRLAAVTCKCEVWFPFLGTSIALPLSDHPYTWNNYRTILMKCDIPNFYILHSRTVQVTNVQADHLIHTHTAVLDTASQVTWLNCCVVQIVVCFGYTQCWPQHMWWSYQPWNTHLFMKHAQGLEHHPKEVPLP
jgi:hypothetical protein